MNRAGLAAAVAGWISASVSLAAEWELPGWQAAAREELAAEGWEEGQLLMAHEDAAADADLFSLEPPTDEERAEWAAPPQAKELPEELFDPYFAARPQSFLVDPQNLLSAADKRDRTEFLDYHASDSTVDLFVYVFGGDQEIPAAIRKEELTERLFDGERPAAVVLYYLGDPERTEFHLSRSLAEAVPATEQRRALQSSVLQAMSKIAPAEQLDAFLIQMSIRVYWMEKMAGRTGKPAIHVPPPITSPAAPREKAKWAGLAESARPWLPHAGAAAGGVLLGAIALAFWRSSRRYRFPEFDVEPRLGGPHAAGVGAVISFASAVQPPASQREQLPEYLRRA